MAKVDNDVLVELKQLLEYAIRKKDWCDITDAYEFLCEEMGLDPDEGAEDEEEESW